MVAIEPQVVSNCKPVVASRSNDEASEFQPMVELSDFDVGATLNTLIARSGRQKLELAAKLGVTEQAVQKWVKTGKIARHHIRGICEFIDCSADELLGIVPIGKSIYTHSQPMRLDPSIVESVANSLLDTYTEEGLVYDFTKEWELFIELYDSAIQGDLRSRGGDVKIGRWIERRSPQGAGSEKGRVGVPASGTDTRNKGVRRKA